MPAVNEGVSECAKLAETPRCAGRPSLHVMIRFGSVLWVLWNLFLAVVPVLLGYAALAVGRRAIEKRAAVLYVPLAALLLLWFLFMPNSCYLFTEPRHLLSAVEEDALLSRAANDPEAALRLGLWTLLALIYSAAGALTFVLSIRPVNTLARMAGIATERWAAPFFILMSLGVYLGLVVRFNSWEAFTNTVEVLQTVARIATRPLLVAAILLFSIPLWLAYVAVDIWIDGAALRWQRLRRSGGASSRVVDA